MITTAFYDPAAKEGKQHDFKGIVVGSLVHAVYYVRYAFIRKCTVQEVLEQLYTIDTRFPGVYQGFEANGFQALYRELLKYKAKEKGYPIKIRERTTIGNKYVRIESLSGFVENGSIVFQKDARGYTSDIGILMDQLLDFPNAKHDDGPDALHYAFEMARDKAMKAAHGSRHKAPKGRERRRQGTTVPRRRSERRMRSMREMRGGR